MEKLKFTQMQFTPQTGLNDKVVYPATPKNEGEARSAIQGISDQIRDYINETLLKELQNADTGKSGAEMIGSSAIQDLRNGDIYPITVRDQLELMADKLKQALTGSINITNIIENGDITGLMIANDTITTDKIADGAITATKIAGGVIDGENLSVASITAKQIGIGAIETDKIHNEAVIETKLGAGSVTKLKLHPQTLAIIPSLNEGVGMLSAGQTMDTYVTVGTYICGSDVIATGIPNCPTNVAFKMFVDYTRGQSDYIVQICRDRTGNQFVRSKEPGQSWTPWLMQANIKFGISDKIEGDFPAGTLYIQYKA